MRVWSLSLVFLFFLFAPSTEGPSSSGRGNKMKAGNLVSESLLDYWFGRCGCRVRLKSSLIRRYYPYLVPWVTYHENQSCAFTLKWFPQMVHKWPLKMISSKIIWILKITSFLFQRKVIHIGNMIDANSVDNLPEVKQVQVIWNNPCMLASPPFLGFEKSTENLQ